MTEVYIVECPGGERLAWQCPNCSRMYPTMDEEAHTLECPEKCRRCGCPMDVAKALTFADEKAREAAAGPRVRETVKI